ncbi:proliferation marker protein Ki-67 isoform X2 [Echeneis naucrates]|nr:proliferation marker protein Ki-67-like isoform X2 [Echeneis naucrates]
MIKKSLDIKTPRKSSVSFLQTPTSRFCTPKPGSAKKNDEKPLISSEDKSIPRKDDAKVFPDADETKGKTISTSNGTPKSVKQRQSFQVPSDVSESVPEESGAVSPQKRNRTTPQRFSIPPPSKSTVRRSKETTPATDAGTKDPEKAISSPKTNRLQKASPRNSGKTENANGTSKKRKSGELSADLPKQQMKRKRVSFGGHLSPELFDKRLPPDSPLRKGATPRRSLCLSKPKQSLLRRASVIGFLKEVEPDTSSNQSPAKKRTSSPKNPSSTSPKTPTPGKKSPKSRSSSPKAASPGKKSQKSESLSPKAASPGKKSQKSKTPSPAKGNTPKTSTQPNTPNSGIRTSTGRFSVSRISTPSPVADVVTDKMPPATVTPKIPLRRMSMKSTSRNTPSVSHSAVKVMRRSGISRASLKVKDSWADRVKYGKTKVQAVVPAYRICTNKTMKKDVPKPQTPARKLAGHSSTGHADSPVTIVVGRAHKQKMVHPTGAAPRLVTNIAVLKKNMKMDEDLSGISEMFKTPVNEKRRRRRTTSVINDSSVTETPMGGLGELSVLNTPEEPGEMMVSPLGVASTMKDRKYSEAVQRFLNGDQESDFVSEIPALQILSESTEQQCNDLKTTPKQKPEQPECLTGVKRIMKTPRQKAEPVDDIRGKLLMTPKQKPEQQECLTGVKRIMKTPRQKAEPVDDIRGKLLMTPKQKPEQQECLSGVKRMFNTPQEEAESHEDLQGTLLNPPKTPEVGEDVEELQETPAHMHESEDVPETTDVTTPKVKSSPLVCLTYVKRIMKTPKEKNAPLEDMVGLKRLMKTPREKAEPVEENFGIRRLMKSPRLRGVPPVEDFDGLKQLMEEPMTDPTGPLKTNEVDMPSDCGVEAKELNFSQGKPQENAPSNVTNGLPQMDMTKEADVNEALVHDHIEVPVDENIFEEQLELKTATGKVTELNTTAEEPGHEKKSVRGRRAKPVEAKAGEDNKDAVDDSEDPIASAPVRGRRGKKTETTAPSSIRRTTRNKNTDVEVTIEESGPQSSTVSFKPRRGRNAKKVSDDQAEAEQEEAPETEMVPKVESKLIPGDVSPKVNDSTLQEKAVSKPKRGRKAKQESEQFLSVEVPCANNDNVLQADMEKDDSEVFINTLELVPNETTLLDVMETVSQAPLTEKLPVLQTETCKVINSDGAVQKKAVRGRRAKMVEAQAAEVKQEASDNSEDAVVPAPVRGRGRKTKATAPPVTQTRTRNAKSQKSTFDNTSEVVPEKPGETFSIQESEFTSTTEEAGVKPSRGRKTKERPAEPEKSEVVGEEQLMVGPQQPTPTVGKPKRGRRTKLDADKQDDPAEDTALIVETNQQPEPPVRARRGRIARQEDEKKKNDAQATSAETPMSQEPIKKLRKNRKAEQDHVEPREEETVVPKESEDAPVEPPKLTEQVSVATKPKRGGRKAKQDTGSEIAVEVSAVSSDKPKRDRRGKQSPAEVRVAVEVGEEKADHELKVEEKKTADAPLAKPSRARGGKTVKHEVSHVIPPKRARRGAAVPLDYTNPESTILVSESVPTSEKPQKRGKRATAKPTTNVSILSSDQVKPSEESTSAVVEHPKMSKRSVKWKAEFEVFHIPKETPAKAARGRKAKLEDQVEIESKNVSQATSKTEEKDLSDGTEAQPTKRARRGAKAADETDSSSQADEKKGTAAEPQLKTRRGRSAKK